MNTKIDRPANSIEIVRDRFMPADLEAVEEEIGPDFEIVPPRGVLAQGRRSQCPRHPPGGMQVRPAPRRQRRG